MESAVRKKRTLAERRESDRLRQRRFRAKKREEALLMQVINGGGDVVEHEKKERVYNPPKRTRDEIRETNRIRQQRFRARKRGQIHPMDLEEEKKEGEAPPPSPTQKINEDPDNFVQKLLLEAASVEKDRATEIRRTKDRIRKRRERQRKKDRAFMMELTSQCFDFDGKFQPLQDSPDSFPIKEQEMEEEEEIGDVPEESPKDSPESHDDNFDTSNFMAQLEAMGLMLDVVAPANDDGVPTLEIKQKEESTPSSSSESPQPQDGQFLEEFPPEFTEKKAWQRCNSAEERRERERMRKRMYRARLKWKNTGKMEMQWDPTPIKRAPNDESETGITPIPEWTSSLTAEQKLIAHRIYNKRYRERVKSSMGNAQRSSSADIVSDSSSSPQLDFSNLSADVYSEILSTISQCDLSTLMESDE